MRVALLVLPCLAALPAIAAQPAAPNPDVVAAVAAAGTVCSPLADGAGIKFVARRAGLRSLDGQWVLPIRGHERVVVTPPDVANPHLCIATFHYALGEGPAMRAALKTWAADQSPALAPDQVNAVEKGPEFTRTVSSWAAATPTGEREVLFASLKTAAGAPADGALDRAVLYVSVTPAKAS